MEVPVHGFRGALLRPPKPPKAPSTHQQVDAAGDAQADGAQDGGEEETGRDSQAVTEIWGSEGVWGAQPPLPTPHPTHAAWRMARM